MSNIETYEGYPITFEKKDGKMMVNATQMAKPFGKQPKDWLKYEQASRIISCVSARRNILPSDLQQVAIITKTHETITARGIKTTL